MSDDPDKDKPPKPSGRVRHDPGGRAVWQWAVDSGKFAVESTSRLLEKLDLSHLRLEDEEKDATINTEAGQASDAEAGKQVSTYGSPAEKNPPARAKRTFNPYDNRLSAGNMKAGKPLPPAKPRITQPVRPAKKPGGFLGRLFGKDEKEK